MKLFNFSHSVHNGKNAIPYWKLQQISQHPSYHGPITWKEAESTLKQHGGNCYLTRCDKPCFMLSVLQRDFSGKKAFREFEFYIQRDPQDLNKVLFEISGTEYPLDSLADLLLFYESAVLSDQSPNGIGVCIPWENRTTPVNPPPGNFPPDNITVPTTLHPRGTHLHASNSGHPFPVNLPQGNSPSDRVKPTVNLPPENSPSDIVKPVIVHPLGALPPSPNRSCHSNQVPPVRDRSAE